MFGSFGAANEYEHIAKTTWPRDTGNLRRSVGVEIRGLKAIVRVEAPYAVPLNASGSRHAGYIQRTTSRVEQKLPEISRRELRSLGRR